MIFFSYIFQCIRKGIKGIEIYYIENEKKIGVGGQFGAVSMYIFGIFFSISFF